MQIVEAIELISINGTLVFQLLSFLIFLFLINRIMIRPLSRQAGDRASHLGTIAKDIEKANSTYDDMNRKMRLQEDDVRQTAAKVRDEMEAAGKQEAGDLIQKTREDINNLRVEAQKKNDAAIADVRRQLDAEAATIADQMIMSILGRRVES